MSTWNDEPNDYEHALAEITRLRAAIYKAGVMLSQGYGRMSVENFLREVYTGEPENEQTRN